MIRIKFLTTEDSSVQLSGSSSITSSSIPTVYGSEGRQVDQPGSPPDLFTSDILRRVHYPHHGHRDKDRAAGSTAWMTELPPGPGMPKALQTAIWFPQAQWMLAQCAARYGETFTLRIFHEDTWVVCPTRSI